MVVNGIMFRTRTGCPWRDLAGEYGHWKTAYNRHRQPRPGRRPPAFDPARYTERNTVERCFGKLKQFRAVATRYDKRDYMYQATLDVASIQICLRDPDP
jgi:transposase